MNDHQKANYRERLAIKDAILESIPTGVYVLNIVAALNELSASYAKELAEELDTPRHKKGKSA